jgi:hypothetical protein
LLQLPIPSKSSGQHQYDRDDQDNPDSADTSVPKAIRIEAAAEAAQQKYDENDTSMSPIDISALLGPFREAQR